MSSEVYKTTLLRQKLIFHNREKGLMMTVVDVESGRILFLLNQFITTTKDVLEMPL